MQAGALLELDQLRPAGPNHDHRPRWRPASLGGAAGVHDPAACRVIHLRVVRVAVGHQIATRKPRPESLVTPGGGTGVMREPDPQALRLNDEPLGQRRAKLRLVDVPVHRLDSREQAELLEDGGGSEVTDVQNQIGASKQLDATLG